MSVRLATRLVASSSRLPSCSKSSFTIPIKPVRYSFRSQSTISTPESYKYNGITYPKDSYSNVPSSILDKLDRNLHLMPSHPISILRQIVENHFNDYKALIPSSAIVSVKQNFDELGFPLNHPGRSLTDSYYLNKEYMLRTHTSSHEIESYKKGLNKWLLSADVFRRDEIDSSHYPVFHQMEGTHIWLNSELNQLNELNKNLENQLKNIPIIIEDETKISNSNPFQSHHNPIYTEQIIKHLKNSLNSLIFKLFGHHTKSDGEPLRVRWIEAYFPFTTPSYEVEVFWQGEWLELLGCGVVMQKTLDQSGVSDKSGWAFGLGLERLSMVLFSIPDIRLFWTSDSRFLSQFKQGEITTFQPYSKFPPCYKDMSFWLPQTDENRHESTSSSAGGKTLNPMTSQKQFHENDYCEIVRDVVGDLIESVTLIDEFTHPKTNRKSKCYRLNYRHMDRNLSNEEVNELQNKVQARVVEEMGIEMR
ncbi:phenylalanine-tRNA ligase [Kwoniella pini CBS 10737]|uniref:Phenylalanine--tRNA ligase, mitochondrial n=1 Tax=Kwoniella pini CBS 10737 TaxID=1296096 RepID=A0A1B9I5L1_9TREE|nr:phenylalanine-tRNA ligase [Kwoniella pini CBS 10737]OCF50810.1 phenylalanine-tRNA ligase [Kwoniella pini CBS 10737]